MTLDEFIAELPERGLRLARELGDEIKSNAEAIYPWLPYSVEVVGGDSYPIAPPTIIKLDTPYGCYVEAEGEGIIFMEFGAGVHFNDGSYPEPKPAGVVGIGQYGSGKGSNDVWQFKDGGSYYTTYGTPATMPMYNSKRIALNEFEKIARRVFDK